MKAGTCKNCGESIGMSTDPWGKEQGWMHAIEDGPDAYYFCRDNQGEPEAKEQL